MRAFFWDTLVSTCILFLYVLHSTPHEKWSAEVTIAQSNTQYSTCIECKAKETDRCSGGADEWLELTINENNLTCYRYKALYRKETSGNIHSAVRDPFGTPWKMRVKRSHGLKAPRNCNHVWHANVLGYAVPRAYRKVNTAISNLNVVHPPWDFVYVLLPRVNIANVYPWLILVEAPPPWTVINARVQNFPPLVYFAKLEVASRHRNLRWPEASS